MQQISAKIKCIFLADFIFIKVQLYIGKGFSQQLCCLKHFSFVKISFTSHHVKKSCFEKFRYQKSFWPFNFLWFVLKRSWKNILLGKEHLERKFVRWSASAVHKAVLKYSMIAVTG